MFGVYIHFPYCRKRCPYCDFAVHARARIPHDRYADAVLAELAARAPAWAGRTCVSVYFGGGTPGLWRADCVARVLAGVRDFAGAGPEREITLEANPDELPRAQLDGLREAGVTRLSLGVESLTPRHLRTLGRLHGPDEPREVVKDARAAGFDAISLDLMFGMPGQTLAELDSDLAGLLALEPEHLSVYNLTIEERTPFGAMRREGTLKLPDGGLQADMYERVMSTLGSAGYEHYEISSWARPGRRAVHNSLYWSGGEYLGLGSSASSFRRLPGGGGERTANVRSVDDYLRAAEIAEREELDRERIAREAMWLGLRLTDGIDRARYRELHGQDPALAHAAEVERLCAEGLLEVTPARLRLTPRGILFADEVGTRFL